MYSSSTNKQTQRPSNEFIHVKLLNRSVKYCFSHKLDNTDSVFTFLDAFGHVLVPRRSSTFDLRVNNHINPAGRVRSTMGVNNRINLAGRVRSTCE